MKKLSIIALVILIGSTSLAESYLCQTTEQSESFIIITIGEESQSSDADGNLMKSRAVEVLENLTFKTAVEAIGTANKKIINLSLLIGGDQIVGLISAKQSAGKKLTGQVTLNNVNENKPFVIECVFSK